MNTANVSNIQSYQIFYALASETEQKRKEQIKKTQSANEETP